MLKFLSNLYMILELLEHVQPENLNAPAPVKHLVAMIGAAAEVIQ